MQPAETAGTTDDAPTNNQHTDLPPVFGIDAEGRRHRWMRGYDRLVVTDGDGTTIHVEALDETTETKLTHTDTDTDTTVPQTVARWCGFIQETTGWVGTWLHIDGWAAAMVARQEAEAAVTEGDR